MRPSFGIASLCAFAFSLACTSTSPTSGERVERSAAAIVNGADDDADSFVVGIDVRAPNFVGSCTGTLLAPNLVLTARHCVSETPATIDCSPPNVVKVYSNYDPSVFTVSQARVLFTAFGKVTSPSWSVRAVYYPNDATCMAGNDDVACGLCNYDLALLELEPSDGGALPTASFPTPASAGPTIGGAYAAIGYGCREVPDGGNVCGTGTRGSTEGALVTALDDLEVHAIAGVCDGDSGSPLYDRGASIVYGVASLSDAACTKGIFERLDAHLPFLRRYAIVAATDGGYEPAGWAVIGPQQDPDAGGAPPHMDDPCDYRPTDPRPQPWIFLGAAFVGVASLRRRSRALARGKPFA